MGLPGFLVDNLLSVVQYPGHTVTGNEELSGHPASSAADGRRDPSDYWSSITPNTDAYLQVVCDRIRGIDMIALDRGHNLAGQTLQLLGSNDGFGTFETICSVVIGSTVGGSFDDALGCVTEEGAWVKRVSLRAYLAYRVVVKAMGASLTPQVVGCWLGKGFYSASVNDWLFNLPTSAEGDTLQGTEVTSELGYVGRGLQVPRREGTIPIKLVSLFNYDLARYHLQMQFGLGRPMWIWFDDSFPQQVFLAIRPKAGMGFRREPRFFWPQITLPYQEHEGLAA